MAAKLVETEAAAAAVSKTNAAAAPVKKKTTKIVRVQKEMVDWIVANPEHKDCACYLDCDFRPGSFLHNDPVLRKMDATFQKAHERELSIINQFEEKGYNVDIEVEVDDDDV